MTLVTIISKDKAFIPLLYHFKDEVATHILIYDIGEEEIEIALDTKKGLKKLSEIYNLNYEIKLMPLDEDSKKDFSKIYKKLKEFSDLALNVAEADSLLVIMMSAFIMQMNGKIFTYDKFDNTFNEIYNKNCQLKKAKNLKLNDYLTLLNYEIEDKKNAQDILKYKQAVLELFKNYPVFKNQRMLLKKNRLKSVYYKNLFKKAGVLEKKLNLQKLNGDIFEEFVFWNLYQLDVDDIWLNVKIVSEREGEEAIKNEFDILMIKDNKIYIVECKFGNLAIKPDELIYKSDSLLSLFGEDTKGVIVYINDVKERIESIKNSTLPQDVKKKKLFNLKKQQISKNLYIRALENNILILHDSKPDFKKFFKVIKDELGIKRRAFLLGGCDLEMAAVARILKKYNQIYFNKNLSWGAKLSDYGEILQKDYCFYAIELKEDITPPKCYKRIDHHDDLSDNPSSIEQVAEILGIELGKFEQSVALNDKGYILLMKKHGLSEKVIRHIRYLDRKFQGVSAEDEKNAENAIKNYKILKGIKVYFTESEKFSPICDRIDDVEYIIYNRKEAVYYGNRVYELAEKLKDYEIYYSKGFLGIISPDGLNLLISSL